MARASCAVRGPEGCLLGKAGRVVLHIGGTFTTGPVEAACVVNEWVNLQAVIASRANALATEGGKLRAGTKTEALIKATTVPVHLPLSGRTMAFGASGACAGGC